MNDVQVVFLAGGKSTRFWPLENKMMLNFMGKTVIQYQLEALRKAGFKSIIVVTSSELGEYIKGEDTQVILQKGDGMGAGVLSAREQIVNTPTLVIIGDDLVDLRLFKQLYSICQGNANTIVGYKTNHYFPGGYLVLDGKKIARIHEKPGEGNTPSDFVDISANFFTSGSQLIHFLEKVQDHDPIRSYEDGLSAMMQAGEAFEMLEYSGSWITLKYPWHTLSLLDHYLINLKTNKIAKGAQIHKTASISGPVMIEKGVRIMECAKITGPTYIGRGAIIGNHTLVRESMIGENTVIGFGSEITRSYVGANCWFHSNYIGDSVVADNVGVGAGAVFANLRLDESEIYSSVNGERIRTDRVKLGAIVGSRARIGIETQLMPGVKVGRQSIVGPGVILTGDLPDKKKCLNKQTQVIVDNTISDIFDRSQFRSRL